MTCPAFRTLATIARQLADLASFLAHPVAGWNAAADELYARATRPRDGAERLADKEAGEEVGEPRGWLLGTDAYRPNHPPK